jgi:C-terminal processing protease CtpA/Prc
MHAAVCLPLIGGPQGLGLVVEDSSEGATIIAEILDEGSASGTNVKKGDVLLEVDGTSVETMSCKEINKVLVGPLGKSAKLKLQSPDGKPFFADLVRQRGGSKNAHVRLPGLLLLSPEAVKAADKV